MKRILITFVLIVLSLSIVSAAGVDDEGNPNDPTLNDRANACFDGGTMEDRCETELDWIAGWYLIRVEFGIFDEDEIPAWVEWVLPRSLEGCYATMYFDFYFTGIPNETGNITFTYSTNDGSCSGTAYPQSGMYAPFVVQGSQSSASAFCENVRGHHFDLLTVVGDLYVCGGVV